MSIQWQDTPEAFDVAEVHLDGDTPVRVRIHREDGGFRWRLLAGYEPVAEGWVDSIPEAKVAAEVAARAWVAMLVEAVGP